MREVMELFRAMADENRVRILCALRGRELCVCQMVELLGLAPSTVSKHLSILRHARLIESRKDGRWVHYRLTRGRDRPAAAGALMRVAFRALSENRRIGEDAGRVCRIEKMDMERLCRRILRK